MQLRLLSIRVIQCVSRPQTLAIGQRSIERCMCTLQHNLKPHTYNLAAVYHQQYRFRRRGVKNPRSAPDESDSDDDDERNSRTQESDNKEYEVEPGVKVITYKLDSPRVDRLLRKALNVSGKNIEDLFYQKKIWLNDEVVKKKSFLVDEGDLITVALEETSGKTARGALIEVLQITEHEGKFSVKVSRNKNTYVSL